MTYFLRFLGLFWQYYPICTTMPNAELEKAQKGDSEYGLRSMELSDLRVLEIGIMSL